MNLWGGFVVAFHCICFLTDEALEGSSVYWLESHSYKYFYKKLREDGLTTSDKDIEPVKFSEEPLTKVILKLQAYWFWNHYYGQYLHRCKHY